MTKYVSITGKIFIFILFLFGICLLYLYFFETKEERIRRYVFHDWEGQDNLNIELHGVSQKFLNQLGVEIIINKDPLVRMRAIDVFASVHNDSCFPYLDYAVVFDKDERVRRRAFFKIDEFAPERIYYLLKVSSSFHPLNILTTHDPRIIYEYPDQVKRLDAGKLNKNDIEKLFPSLSSSKTLDENNFSILQLKNLQGLFFSNSDLKGIPVETGKIESLHDASFAENKIKKLDGVLIKLTNLRTLDLSGNQISSISGELNACSKLEWLDLSGNKINSVIDEIRYLKQLKYLGLLNTKISKDEILEIKNIFPDLKIGELPGAGGHN